MSSQMTTTQKDKKLQEFIENEKHLLAQLKFHNYIIEEYKEIRKNKLEILATAQSDLNKLDEAYSNAPTKITYLQKQLEKNRKGQHKTKDREGKIRKFLRMKEKLAELQMELAVCS